MMRQNKVNIEVNITRSILLFILILGIMIYYYVLYINSSVSYSHFLNNAEANALYKNLFILFIITFIAFIGVYWNKINALIWISILVLLTISPNTQIILTGTNYATPDYAGFFKISLFATFIFEIFIFNVLLSNKLAIAKSDLNIIVFYFILIVLLMIISVLKSKISGLALVLENFAVPFCLLMIFLNRQEKIEKNYIINALKIGIWINFLVGTFEFITNKNTYIAYIAFNGLRQNFWESSINHIRSIGLVGHPLNYALVGLLSITLYIITQKRHDIKYIIIGLLMVIFSVSRAALAIGLILLLISSIMIMKDGKGQKYIKLIYTMVFSVLILLMIFVGGNFAYTRNLNDSGSTLARINSFTLLIDTIKSGDFIIGSGVKEGGDYILANLDVDIPENPLLIMIVAFGIPLTILYVYILYLMFMKLELFSHKLTFICLFIYLLSYLSFGTKFQYINILYILWYLMINKGAENESEYFNNL